MLAWDLMVPPMNIQPWTINFLMARPAKSHASPSDRNRRARSVDDCWAQRLFSPTLSINSLCFTGAAVMKGDQLQGDCQLGLIEG